MTQEVDQSTCWYQPNCAKEMNRFYDEHLKDQDVTRHFGAFTTLLGRTDLRGCKLIDLGCGTAMLSDFCQDFLYTGSDLPHILGDSAMRNYPKYLYKACDLMKDDLNWINEYPIAVLNGVMVIMQYPLALLERVLLHCKEYLIIHRQEITEAGATHVADGPGYGGRAFHSTISRKDFTALADRMHFDIVQEVRLQFGNWENGGSSFLLRRRKSHALNRIDYSLYEKYFAGKENGFFIEAGANDGLTQSNTYYFEHYKNWKGILIEPLPEQHSECYQNRSPQTYCVHGALTHDPNLFRIDMIYTPSCKGLMSIIDSENTAHLMRRVPAGGIPMIVPATTLNRVLDEYLTERRQAVPLHIDLLVLDIEGYECNALMGLDLRSPSWNVDYILVEELEDNGLIENYLQEFGYYRIDALSDHDFLYSKLISR